MAADARFDLCVGVEFTAAGAMHGTSRWSTCVQELGEPEAVPQQLVQAVLLNNEALECLEAVAPRPCPTGRRARRRHHREREQQQANLAGADVSTPSNPDRVEDVNGDKE